MFRDGHAYPHESSTRVSPVKMEINRRGEWALCSSDFQRPCLINAADHNGSLQGAHLLSSLSNLFAFHPIFFFGCWEIGGRWKKKETLMLDFSDFSFFKARRIQADYIFFPYLVQYRPSSAYNSPYFTTNAGAPVYNNDSSLTVGSRGIVVHYSVHVVVGIP